MQLHANERRDAEDEAVAMAQAAAEQGSLRAFGKAALVSGQAPWCDSGLGLHW